MRELIAVALGGMIGSVTRYGVGVLAVRRWGSYWPMATLAVNIVGCFAIGYLVTKAKKEGWLNSEWEIGLRSGFLGGLTTFSAFGLEVTQLWQENRYAGAFLILMLNVGVGIAAVIAGQWLANR